MAVDGEHLVVVVPGIGGSVLADPARSGAVAWDAGVAAVGRLALAPARLSTAEAPRLEPIGLIRSTAFLGFTLVPGYERLVDQLRGLGPVDERGDPRRPVAGARVVVVPYDFRHSILSAAERLDAVVRAHLDDADDEHRRGRVVVVAHSMGGLVARVWTGLLGRWPWCRALITLGTPHRGAPKALDWLLHGVPFVRGVGAVLRGWDSVAELLPRFPAVHDTDSGADLYPHELGVDWLTAPAARAYQLHTEIERAWDGMPRSGPETVPCLGWSHRTPTAVFRTNGRLRITKDTPTWLGLEGWEHDLGDGTVPAFSALPPELDQHVHSPVRLRERHGPLAATPLVADLVGRQFGRRPPTAIHGDRDGRRPPTLGVDLDEIHAAGEPLALAVAIRAVRADPAELAGQAVWVRLRPAGGGAPDGARADVRLSWDETRHEFHGTLPGQPPGLYAITVTARGVPAAGDLSTADTIAVVGHGG